MQANTLQNSFAKIQVNHILGNDLSVIRRGMLVGPDVSVVVNVVGAQNCLVHPCVVDTIESKDQWWSNVFNQFGES